MWFFKKQKKEIDELSESALKELRKLKKKKINSELIVDLNKIFRIYLREKLKLKESLTYEELSEKIKHKKIKKEQKEKIMFLFSKIYNIEYKSGNFSRKIFNSLLKDFRQILKS